MLSNKSQTLARLDTFFKMVETQFADSVKSVRTDNEAEFLSRESQKLFLALGILHQKSCAYYFQQNEVIERKYKHLLQLGRPSCFMPFYLLNFGAMYS